MVSIVTMNVRGLRDDKKRKEIFYYCKRNDFDIIMLQETHSTKEDEEIWRTQWNGTVIYDHGDSKARGTAILFRKHLDATNSKITRSKVGRYIIVDCKINGKEIMLINVYAPNNDEPEFFVQLFKAMSLHSHADRIMAGDMNLTMETTKDSINRKNNNEKALHVLKAYLSETMMTDIWRQNNPDTFQFTWYRRKPEEIYVRLDYVYVNYAIVTDVEKICIKPAFRSDHSMCLLKICTEQGAKRGARILEV